MMKRYIIGILAAFLAAIGANAQKEFDYEAVKDKFNFIVCNDLGRNGYYDQKPIAEKMGEMSEKGVDPEFVMALGDIHHFNGVRSVEDPLWMTNYELIYSHPELMLDWFPVCGNHEYRGNTQAFIDYNRVSRRWEMFSRYYTQTYKDKNMSLRIVWIDTTPLISKYRTSRSKYPDAALQDKDRQLAWLDSVLTVSREQWIIVGGHHPIFAQTDKDEEERIDMQREVDSILRRHRVDIYINGHIHNFQHIRRKDSHIDYITNSSASLSRKVKPIEGTIFCSPEPGFSIISIDGKSLVLRMIDKEGKILHEVVRKK